MITSAPIENRSAAVFSVIPMPPAEFSPLTITRSGAYRSRRPGIARREPGAARLSHDVGDEQDLHRRLRYPQSRSVPSVSGQEATGAAVIEARDLTKRFGERAALRDVSFTASPGELLAVIGPNGAGKTTLLSILAGIRDADSGTISVPGEIGWVPQGAALYSRLTVAENLRLFARLEGREDVEAAVEQMVGQTGLGERRDDLVGTLSGGNQQRVNIAIGLLVRAGGPAARRAVDRPRPAPARAPVGVRARTSRARARR